TYKINRGHGERLLRIISAENATDMKNGDNLSGRCLFNNLGGVMTKIFNTQLDNRRIQPEDLTVATSDDYKYNREKLQHCILANVQEYYTNCPVHIDDWSAVEDLTQ